MVNQDLVSVVVCSYNNEKFVLDCLNSIFDQSYENIELLISDDCSTDRTYEIIKEWCESHKKRFARCYYKQNQINIGISRNYNSILKYAKGSFIKIFASDDVLFEDAIGAEVNFLINNLNFQIVYANCIIINKNDIYPIQNINDKEVFYTSIPKSGKKLVKDLVKNDFIAAPTVMFRGDTFNKYGYFREDMSFEDWEYWIRLSKNDASIGYLDKIILGYRVYKGSSSHTGSDKIGEHRFIVNTQTEEKILLENKEYFDNDTLELFWTRVFNTIIKNNYKEAFNIFYYNTNFVKNFKIKLKIILFRFNLL